MDVSSLRLAGLFAAALLASCVNTAPPPDRALQDAAAGVLAAAPAAVGVAITVIDDAALKHGAAGLAAPDNASFSSETPFRIASVTKTFVAATVLRLVEEGRLSLDDAIAALIDPAYDDLLRGDGYDTATITVRHLMMHVSGMPDHADEKYVAQVLADPSREWTRRDQIAFLVENHDPLGQPGAAFRYSDTGYVLLGDIIERRTGASLASAVREAMRFDEIGMTSTWWERAEPAPAGAVPRARQYLGGADVSDFDPSIDLYGGGGLVSTTSDLARFMAALMNGEIFERRETLTLMMTAPGHPEPDKYRLGLFPKTVGDAEVFEHGGFWGVQAGFAPEHDVDYAGAVLDQSAYRILVEALNDAVANAIAD